jgi:Zn-dependent protease
MTWKLFSVAGIDVKLHWTTLLLMILSLLNPVFFIVLLTLFASVTLHELSHSLVAKDNGLKIDQILLLPIGGMAAMKEASLDPNTEFKMAIAGPLFNFALCSFILLATGFLGNGLSLLSLQVWEESLLPGTPPVPIEIFFLSTVFWLNAFLGAFNLFFPAIPMDGGRVLRSLLAMFMSYVKATRIATALSTVLTIFLFAFAVYNQNLILIIISVFIFVGARSGLEYALSSRLLGDFPVKRLVRQNYLVVEEDKTLEEIIAEMIASRSLVAFAQKDHISSVSIYDIRHVSRKEWKKTKFKDIAVKQKPITLDHPASYALDKMRELDLEALPVVEDGDIIGCVFKEDVDVVLELLKVSRS